MSDSNGQWTLTVYRDGVPEPVSFATEDDARDAARQLERDGWANGIPDTLTSPAGETVWHRPHDAAG
ncbi:hypothetical protein ACFP2T_30240 [Plantactinospora solaniradicis]|uniref:SPOR domain-containing protein n=1 Tax=Plantactinospora solaniradicis TaxID=1723736 RepID=A0ABW1KGW9_9ACTN